MIGSVGRLARTSVARRLFVVFLLAALLPLAVALPVSVRVLQLPAAASLVSVLA